MILCALYVFNDNPLYAHLAKACLSPEPHLINLGSLLALTKTAKYWPPGPQLPAALHLVSTFVELERLYCYAKFTGWLVSAEERQVESVIPTVFVRIYLRKWDMKSRLLDFYSALKWFWCFTQEKNSTRCVCTATRSYHFLLTNRHTEVHSSEQTGTKQNTCKHVYSFD